MFICNCNGIRGREVRQAIASGATRPSQIFASHGCSPQCAKCICDMVAMIREEQKDLRKTG